ncbi:MAG: type VII secretion protein EccCa [Microbacterium sp.]
MTVQVIHRPARITEPVEPVADIVLAPPPPIGESTSGFPLQSLLPVVGSLSSITMIVLLRNNPVMVVVGAVILIVALIGGVGMAFTARGNAARQRRIQRERYLDYLEETRGTVRELAATQRDALLTLNPSPTTLVEIGSNPARRWERRPSDADFLRVRLGTGDLRVVDVRLPPEQNPVQPFDPVMKGSAERVVRLAGVAQGAPALVDLERGGHVSLVGERAHTLAAARAFAAQIATLHSPDDVHLAAVIPPAARADWAGFDLLPHVSAAPAPGAVAGRRIAPTLPELLAVIGDELRDRIASAAATRRSGRRTKPGRLILFIDEGTDAATGLPRLDSALSLTDLGVTVVHLVDDRLKEPATVSARVTLTHDSATVETPGAGEEAVTGIRPDIVDGDLLTVVARPLAGLRLTRTSAVDAQTALAPDVAELLGIADVDAIDLRDAWLPRSAGDFLRVPIGVDDRGAPVLLDLKESAQLGMGPHGICIGATGSGKSELLRTLILGLALTHSPDDLSMILVDYKGGAAFAPFAQLPHVAGIIDNLADDPQLTERARESIQGEVVRRQRLLKDAGNAASIGHYRQLRRERADLPALPHLFLVIDEFGELLTAEPDFVELLLTIGRIGRSIGVHLLLSSQRIEGGRLRGLDTYLSYRIGLRTFSESESAVVLDTPDAFHLPAIPGYGYLKVDTSVYTRFRAGFVSGPVPDPVELDPRRDETAPVIELPDYDLPASEPVADAASAAEPDVPTTGRTLVQAATSRLSRGVARTRPVWLPPLPPILTLGGVLPSAESQGGALRAPIGLLDDPTRQRQAPWMLDLTRSGGHISITGAPQSGRSTFLRTLAASLAFSHSPREVSVYGMDLTGGGLGRIEPFPHVGGVATRGHRERLTRLLEELTGMLATRERVFRDHGLDSLADMRRQHADGKLPQLQSADVVLLVDGLGALRTDFEDLEAPLAQLLERGGSFGIHVVVTLSRWSELRLNLQGLVGTRLELKLNDPADSQIARKLSATLRADEPGRVLTDDKLFAQIALPLLEEVDDADMGEALEQIARESAQRWGGPGAAPIRLLPEDLAPDELPDALDEPDAIPIGLRQDSMQPLSLDLVSRDPHLLVLGDSRCGKTTALRGIVQGAIDRHSPEELVIGLMDTRGDLAGEIPDAYLGGHAASGRQARLLAESIATELEKRQADRGAPGPRILVIADDFDILAAGGTEPLRPLLPYLASARDLRLNVVVSRPVAGASRAMFDVALQGVRDTGGTVLIMSGDRAEGQLLPKLYAEPMIAGRGRLARRGERPTLIQIANFVPTPAAVVDAPLPRVEADALSGAIPVTEPEGPEVWPDEATEAWPAEATEAEAEAYVPDDPQPSTDSVPLSRRARRHDAP